MEIYTYYTKLPPGVAEMVTPCFGGYTIYIDNTLTFEGRMRAFRHALYHIEHGDFDRDDVQQIEAEAHRKAV